MDSFSLLQEIRIMNILSIMAYVFLIPLKVLNILQNYVY